ncbi:MAG TPA: DNA internalization-related competence protein ComEC/Rec2, partial [Burkholderiaceae bacterium]|nr:DNA internalization-related competence protein ComEC/Rec2 [Burkholderiaceae bacterium]
KPSMLAVGLAMAGGAWLFAPRGVPGRVGAIALFIPLLLTPEPRPAEGDWRATFLDIGQGTAVVIETARHRLLYDTGPKWSDDADAGQRVVLPHLRAIGARRLDAMVVSHADNDHSGGALAVLDAREVEWLLTSIEHEAPISRAAKQWRRCESGQRWEWDGVRFEVLHPSAESYAQEAKTNARSCVLKIANQHGGLLLTGDIEAAQERALVDTASPMLRADVLAVPHHGSLTSSTEGFVDAVAPRIAIVQAGWFNRFGHPRADVLARYADRGVDIARTDRDGAIEVRFSAQGTNMTRLREQYARYWHGR